VPLRVPAPIVRNTHAGGRCRATAGCPISPRSGGVIRSGGFTVGRRCSRRRSPATCRVPHSAPRDPCLSGDRSSGCCWSVLIGGAGHLPVLAACVAVFPSLPGAVRSRPLLRAVATFTKRPAAPCAGEVHRRDQVPVPSSRGCCGRSGRGPPDRRRDQPVRVVPGADPAPGPLVRVPGAAGSSSVVKVRRSPGRRWPRPVVLTSRRECTPPVKDVQMACVERASSVRASGGRGVAGWHGRAGWRDGRGL
jgi:hypothetical protein